MTRGAITVVDVPSLEEAPAPLPAQTEELATLKIRIRAGLVEQRKLSERLCQDFVDTAEINVRLGWALEDAFAVLPKGSWSRWVEAECGIHQPAATNLRRFAAKFSRDAIDLASRVSRHVRTEGFASTIGPNLRTQIIEISSAANLKSQNALMRFLQVKSRTARKQAALLERSEPLLPFRVNGESPNGACSPLKRLLTLLQESQTALEQADFSALSSSQRKSVETRLAPLLASSTRALSRVRGV
jgi:hypothetical protein